MKHSFMFSMIAATLVTAAPVMTVPAAAQPMAADLLPPYEVSTIIASMGMRPIDRPMWRNGRYVVHATDRNGRDVRIVLDGRDGQVIAVRPIDRVGYDDGPRYAAPPPPPPAYSGGYPAAPNYGPRYDGGYRVAPPAPPPADDDDDDDFDYDRQQGSLMPRPAPPPGYGQPPIDQRRYTSIAPDRKVASPRRTQERAAAPIPRPKPSIASVTPPAEKPADPASTGSTRPETKPEARKPDPAKSEAKAEPGKSEPGKSEPGKGEKPKTEIRVIDLSKPKPPEEKAAESKPEARAPEGKASETKAPETKAPETKSSDNEDKPASGIRF